jgi:lipopolysaccharide export system protein LptA
LTGDVSIQLPQLELTAQRVEARQGSGAGLQSLNGRGEVRVKLGQTFAEAASFDVDLRTHVVKLTGPVRVTLGGGWTSAASAEVDTRSGRLVLHRVKGSLPLGEATPVVPSR